MEEGFILRQLLEREFFSLPNHNSLGCDSSPHLEFVPESDEDTFEHPEAEHGQQCGCPCPTNFFLWTNRDACGRRL